MYQRLGERLELPRDQTRTEPLTHVCKVSGSSRQAPLKLCAGAAAAGYGVLALGAFDFPFFRTLRSSRSKLATSANER
jgi:hypothetical protein